MLKIWASEDSWDPHGRHIPWIVWCRCDGAGWPRTRYPPRVQCPSSVSAELGPQTVRGQTPVLKDLADAEGGAVGARLVCVLGRQTGRARCTTRATRLLGRVAVFSCALLQCLIARVIDIPAKTYLRNGRKNESFLMKLWLPQR